MSEFAGTAEYYASFRPGVPPAVVDVLLVAANRNAPASSLLDLGTGTGQVIEALFPSFEKIFAIDPDAEMLQVAEERLRTIVKTASPVSFHNCRAEAFEPPVGTLISFVTICRAFHWMDQPGVLAKLATYVAPTGAVAIFGDNSFWEADSEWKRGVRAVIQSFLGEPRRAGSGTFSHHNRPYTDILKESPFEDVEEFTVPVERVWSSGQILGYLYSTSFAAKHLFGSRLEEFEASIKKELLNHSGTDAFQEKNVFLIRIGRLKEK